MFPALTLAAMLADPSQCESIAKLTLANTTITSARWADAGPMTAAPATPAATLPAHCRVAIVMRPSSDSHIEAEIWLPAQWNGKFQAVGNGGWAGTISYAAMARALGEGYATRRPTPGTRAAAAPLRSAIPKS
jgi:feruloyl esterase